MSNITMRWLFAVNFAMMVAMMVDARNVRKFHFVSHLAKSDEDCLDLGKNQPESLDLRIGGGETCLQNQAHLLQKLTLDGNKEYRLCLCHFEDDDLSSIGMSAFECSLIEPASDD